jgi:hypothetical protein
MRTRRTRNESHFPTSARLSRIFPADVDELTTGQTCLDNLVAEKFIEPAEKERPYALVVQRSQAQVLPHMSMQDSGVRDQDALAIILQEQGAHCTAIASLEATAGEK